MVYLNIILFAICVCFEHNLLLTTTLLIMTNSPTDYTQLRSSQLPGEQI